MGLIVNPCLPFTGYRNAGGYGMHRHGGRVHLAHRVAYAKHHGLPMSEVPPLLRHTCDNPACREPTHLLPGTQAQNMQDMVDRGRQPRGVAKWGSKLTPADVTLIRELHIPCENSRRNPGNTEELAKRFGVSPGYILRIVKGNVWKSLE